MVITAIVGYLLGSIPTALIVARFFRLDPRKFGDGNPGWWNMRQLVGERAAAVVLVGDVLKGMLAAGVGIAIWGDFWWMPYIGVAAAMVGHAFPVFARFRGGYSILTWAGGMLVVSPFAGIIAIAMGAALGFAGRRLAWGCRLAFVAFPIVQVLFDPLIHVAMTGVLMAFIGARFVYGRSLTRRSGRATPSPAAASSS